MVSIVSYIPADERLINIMFSNHRPDILKSLTFANFMVNE